VFRKTGTTHLVVISGSHVGLIAGLAYFLVLRFWARTGWLKWSPQTVAAVVAMVAAVFLCRPGRIFSADTALGHHARYCHASRYPATHIRPFNTLAVALVAVLLFDPFSVLSVGFWLSFLAVLMIVYVIAGRLRSSGYFLDVIKSIGRLRWAYRPCYCCFFSRFL
jgi:competence protein ComEC